MEEGRDCNVRPHYIILLGIPLQEETKLEGFKGHIYIYISQNFAWS